MLNYKKIVGQEPTILAHGTNVMGQKFELLEHPTLGDSFPVIVSFPDLKRAFNSGFHDAEDMTGSDEYSPCVIKGELVIGPDAEQIEQRKKIAAAIKQAYSQKGPTKGRLKANCPDLKEAGAAVWHGVASHVYGASVINPSSMIIISAIYDDNLSLLGAMCELSESLRQLKGGAVSRYIFNDYSRALRLTMWTYDLIGLKHINA